jgi:hypothetical protein
VHDLVAPDLLSGAVHAVAALPALAKIPLLARPAQDATQT